MQSRAEWRIIAPEGNREEQGEGQALRFSVIRSKRKSISLRLLSPDEGQIRAPLNMPQREIEAFVRARQPWIDARVRELERRASLAPFGEDELKSIKKRAQRELLPALRLRAAQMGIEAGKISFRFQKGRFGSCSSRGNISLNCLLVLMPPALRDYVIVHELCHRVDMSHSASFYAQVRRVLPTYDRSRAWLKENGPILLERAFPQE